MPTKLKPVKSRIRKWVARLNSGKYTQYRGGLVKRVYDELPKRHCCLAVACEVYIAEKHLSRRKFWNVAGHNGTLPKDVAEWFGFESPDPKLGKYEASIWNDQSKADFALIAKKIKAKFLPKASRR